MKSIFIVTHGEKYDGPNPAMTKAGKIQVRELRNRLPQRPSEVVVGTGWRHLQTARVLNLKPTRYTATVGSADSSEVINGSRFVILADGTAIDADYYTTIKDDAVAVERLIWDLPHNAVICAGRPALIMLEVADAESAAVYQIDVDEEIAMICEITKIST